MDSLQFLVHTIHTVVLATVNEKGEPVTCAADMMHADENGLYFLSAKGKSLYERLVKTGRAALTGIHGMDTMHSQSISVRGKVKRADDEMLQVLLRENPYMLEIYPTEESRRALGAFVLYEGEGEWFDLSKRPIERAYFAIGKGSSAHEEYFITDACTGCRLCQPACPQNCIDFSALPARIEQDHCLHCGQCRQVCPYDAVILQKEEEA